jgi:hypothetical protein
LEVETNLLQKGSMLRGEGMQLAGAYKFDSEVRAF